MKNDKQHKFEGRVFSLAKEMELDDMKAIPCLVSVLMAMIDTVSSKMEDRRKLVDQVYETMTRVVVTGGAAE